MLNVRKPLATIGISALMLAAAPAAAATAAPAHVNHQGSVLVYFADPGPTVYVRADRIHPTTCGIDDDPFDCTVKVNHHTGYADLRSLAKQGVRFRRGIGWHQVWAKRCYAYVGGTLRYVNAAQWKPLHLAHDGSGDLIVHHGRTNGRVVPKFWLRALNGHAE